MHKIDININNKKVDCPCKNTGCANHGLCKPCIDKHKNDGKKPHCQRE